MDKKRAQERSPSEQDPAKPREPAAVCWKELLEQSVSGEIRAEAPLESFLDDLKTRR